MQAPARLLCTPPDSVTVGGRFALIHGVFAPLQGDFFPRHRYVFPRAASIAIQ